MANRHGFLRRQRKKANFADLGLNPDTPLPFASTVQALGQSAAALALPLDLSAQYPLINDAGVFRYMDGISDPNGPDWIL